MTIRNAVVLGVLLWAFALPASAQDTCKRNRESGFSYCPPPDWTISPSMDDRFKTFIGPASPVLTPNLNTNGADDNRSLPDFVAANVQTILADPKSAAATAVTVLSQSDFVTAAGARGIRVVYHVESAGQWRAGSFSTTSTERTSRSSS